MLAAAAGADSARTYFVATNGSDANPGTQARPWRTIQKAANTVPPGSTVEIRGGTYHERVVVRVSGAPGAWITFRNHDGEHVRIDGGGLGPFDGIAGLSRSTRAATSRCAASSSRTSTTFADSFVPAGVFVTGTAHHIDLRDLDVHDIQTKSADAHGIAVYGTSGDRPIHDVVIDGNTVHDNRLGSSESVVVNGNVRGWAITHNHVYRNDNIGIDAIGFEGKSPRNDQARDGVIADTSSPTSTRSATRPTRRKTATVAAPTRSTSTAGATSSSSATPCCARTSRWRSPASTRRARRRTSSRATTCSPTARRSGWRWAATTASAAARSTRAW
jgi:hypothetical protein